MQILLKPAVNRTPIPWPVKFTRPQPGTLAACNRFSGGVIAKTHGMAGAHHALIEFDAAGHAADQIAPVAVRSLGSARHLASANEATQMRGGFETAAIFKPFAAATLFEFGRIDALEPEPSVADCQTVAIDDARGPCDLLARKPLEPRRNECDARNKRCRKAKIKQFAPKRAGSCAEPRFERHAAA